jgi:IS5 family transposase
VRRIQNTQAELLYQVPEAARLTAEYFGAYDRISGLLDAHPAILRAVHADLEKPLARLQRRGRRGRGATFTSDSVLRLAIVKVRENTSFRETVVRVDDSARLRAFTRIHHGRMMDHSTLCALLNAIQPATWKQVNDVLAESAARASHIEGERLRLDTTAVETNIHWPTDSGLLWDTYRVLARLVYRVRELAPALANDKRLHAKAVKRLHTRISRVATRKTDAARDERKRLYGRMLALVQGILDWLPGLCAQARREAPRLGATLLDCLALEAAIGQIEHYRPLGQHAVEQARRRVLEGEQVPNDEKLFSLFEPHTELLIRGKASTPVEFGHMVSLHQVEGGFITGYDVFEKRPVDHSIVDPALARHEALFGSLPRVLAADKGYWESSEKTAELVRKIPVVSIGKKGGRTEEETAREHSLGFRLGQCFRAGIEGSISFLKLILGMGRCLNKGFAHFDSTVGATVFTHNLLVLARAPG